MIPNTCSFERDQSPAFSPPAFCPGRSALPQEKREDSLPPFIPSTLLCQALAKPCGIPRPAAVTLVRHLGRRGQVFDTFFLTPDNLLSRQAGVRRVSSKPGWWHALCYITYNLSAYSPPLLQKMNEKLKQ